MAAQPLTTWILLTPDGRHVSLSRAAEPTAAELVTFAPQLAAMGLGGWLVRMVGDYHGKRPVSLTMLREVAPVEGSFDRAVERFLAIRAAR